MTDYVPLWCKSNFSFLEGASHPDELVERAAELGLTSLALTDRDGIYGVVEAHVKARELGVKLIVGSEVTLHDGTTLLLLAAGRQGYSNLCRLVTIGRLRSPKGESRVGWSEVCSHAAGVLALWGGDCSLLVADAEPFFVAHELREAFGDRLYAMVTRHRRAVERPQEARLRRRALRFELPTVAGMEVLYHRSSRRELQDVLTCLRHGVKLVDAGRCTRPNAEHALRSGRSFKRLFEDDPAAVERTLEIAERCSFSLDKLRYRYPAELLPDGSTTAEWLRSLTLQGAHRRYGETIPEPVLRQLDRELGLIEELDYGGYFLTMKEIVRFCQGRGILCQGRGSAANSAVCYCLEITAVDPVRMGLLFERFLSRERAEPPDIDLDIEHERREEVIQHVYAKYGRSHAAMVANIVRYRSRSAVRDVGKVLGIPETALDRVAKLLSRYGDDVGEQALRHAGLDPEHKLTAHLLRLVPELLDFPRHLSIHPGGFLLGQQPVSDLVPIENASMAERTVIQWDKNSIEALGLFKVDLLGLGALHQLHLGFDLLQQHYNESWSMATIPADDRATFDMICAADTVGTFQIESRAQMSMLPRLRPRNYYDLVIEVSIVRPGPITGGMVHPYLRRRSGEEPVIYPHPSLEPVLKKTLGVPLFQEQVMRLSVVAADYTPGEADQLRRDMAAWRRSGRLERHRQRLVERMCSKGIEQEFAERVFEQIRGFGEYGFPESHAASFALIAYATSWMRCHHPDVFACSLLNAQPMGFYSVSTIVEDARRHKVSFLPIDVLRSDWHCTLEEEVTALPRHAVRMGLRYVRGLGRKQVERLLAERKTRSFASVRDLVQRTRLDEGALSRLAESGALRGLESNRRQALWEVRGAHGEEVGALSLDVAERRPGFAALDRFDTVDWDYRTARHSTDGHPLAALRDEMKRRRWPDASSVLGLRDGARVHYAGLVICRQRPGTASGVLFMTLEDESGFVNVVVWSRVFEEYALLVKSESFLGVSGRLQVQEGVTHLVADCFWLPRLRSSPRSGRSRDFR